MQQNNLSRILSDLHSLGYIYHFYKQGNSSDLYFNGSIILDINIWLHCIWTDEQTKKQKTIYCCSNGSIKGFLIE